MSKFLKLCLFSVVALVVLGGCGRESADQKHDAYLGNNLRILNWADFIGSKTLASFAAKYPKTIVNYQNFLSNEELVAKIATSGDSFDVIFPSGYAAEILLKRGLLRRLDKSVIPNIKNVLPQFRAPTFDPNMDYCVPYTWSAVGITYNKKQYDEIIAKDTAFIFEKGGPRGILMLDDMRADYSMALKHLGYSVNATDKQEIEHATKLLVAQKERVKVYASANLIELLASEGVRAGLSWSGDALQAAQKNPNVGLVIPKQGSALYIEYLCVPASSQNPKAAALFINHILDGEVSLDIATTTRYPTANVAAKDLASGDVRNLWAILDDTKAFRSLEPLANVGGALSFYEMGWKKVKAK